MEKAVKEEIPSAKQIASVADIEAAINALSQKELDKLDKSARSIVSFCIHGRTYQDLLQEALLATYEGKRKWNKNISFAFHLYGAMKSIAYNWRRKVKKQNELLESEVILIDNEGKETSLLINKPSVSDVEQEFILKEEPAILKKRIESIEKLFREDMVVSNILEGLKAGFKGPEIQEYYEISPSDYDAARKRLRRKTNTFSGKDEHNV